MKKRWKIIITIAIAVVVLGGLFLLRTYYAGLYGIDADIASDMKLVGEKKVADGDFEAGNNQDQLTNLTRSGDGYIISPNQAEDVCGDAPNQSVIEDFEGDQVQIELEEITDTGNYEVDQIYPNYYLEGEERDVNQDNQFDINSVQVEDSHNDTGFSIYRGPGWLSLQLNRDPAGGDYYYSGVRGSITFPEGINLAEQAIVNYNGEEIDDGEVGWNSLNDEVSLDRENNKVDFTLVTSDGYDKFYINYCIEQTEENVGGIWGRIDLGSEYKLANMKLDLENYLEQDDIEIRAILGKEGLDEWTDLMDPAVSDSELIDLTQIANDECYQHVSYLIKMNPSTDIDREPLKFKGLKVYGLDCESDQINGSGDSDNIAKRLISTGSSFWLVFAVVVIVFLIIIFVIAKREE
jgi:hypothetical protein